MNVKDIVFPGTHDSATSHLEFSWRPVDTALGRLSRYPCLHSTLYKWSATQSLTLEAQLNLGVRYLDLDVCYRPDHPDAFFSCHTYAGVSLHGLLHTLAVFAHTHPYDPVIVEVSPIFDRQAVDITGLHAQLQDLLKQYLDPHIDPAGWDKTIGQLTGPLLLFYNRSPFWGSWIDTSSYDAKVSGLRRQLSGMTDGQYQLAWTLTPQTSDIVKGLVKCGDRGVKSLAERINPRLSDFLSSLTVEDRQKIGAITVDYVELSDVVEVCKKLTVEKNFDSPK